MLIPAPSTSLTQPSGWAKVLVRGEGDGRPGAVSPLQGSGPQEASGVLGGGNGRPAYCWGIYPLLCSLNM